MWVSGVAGEERRKVGVPYIEHFAINFAFDISVLAALQADDA